MADSHNGAQGASQQQPRIPKRNARRDSDLGSATDAMQRAADAMVAATESLRKQFMREQRPNNIPGLAYRTYQPYSSPATAQRFTESFELTDQSSLLQKQKPNTRETSQGLRPDVTNSTPPTRTPSAAPLPSFFPSRPEPAKLDTGVKLHKQGIAADGDSFVHDLPPRSGEAAPRSIQVGRWTYVLQDMEALEENKNMKQQPEGEQKSGKGKPGGPPLTFWHEVLFVLIISTAQSLMLAGVAQALAPAAIIGQTFNQSRPADLASFSASYALTAGTFVLPSGRLGDLFGHKRVFVAGFFWFATWSLIAGFGLRVQQQSGDGGGGVVFFNFSRAMQGIGPALLVPNGQAMLGRAYAPGPRKNLVMSLFGAAAPFGFVVGAVMSCAFAQLATWPWAFWLLAIVCVIFGAMSVAGLPGPTETLPPPPTGNPDGTGTDTDEAKDNGEKKKKHKESLWTRLDAPGIIFGVSGLVLFNFSWNQAPLVGWSTPYVYFLLIISLLLIGAFIYVEQRARHPLVPLRAMGTTQTSFVLGCTAAGWGSFSIWLFYSFQFSETLRGWSPLLTAGSYAHAPIMGLVASVLTARLLAHGVKPHYIFLVSMTAFFLGSLFFATAPVRQTYWANAFLGILIMPFGMDMSNPAATILLSNSVGREHQGVAASLVVTVVNYSISTALGFAAVVEVHVNDNGRDVLAGFRGAQYFGLGLAVLGIAIALAFLLTVPPRGARERADRAEVTGNVTPAAKGLDGESPAESASDIVMPSN